MISELHEEKELDEIIPKSCKKPSSLETLKDLLTSKVLVLAEGSPQEPTTEDAKEIFSLL